MTAMREKLSMKNFGFAMGCSHFGLQENRPHKLSSYSSYSKLFFRGELSGRELAMVGDVEESNDDKLNHNYLLKQIMAVV